jgi:peptide/nickel transport system substrate-binding protein
VRGYQSSERTKIRTDANYQLIIDLALYYPVPHPYRGFQYYLTKPYNNPDATSGSKGYNWPWKQTLDGQQEDINDLITKASTGFDPAPQKPYVAKLARIVNDQLPVLSLWERYANDPINTKDRVTGWRALDDPIYKNNQRDNYAALQFLNGELKPVAGSDKTIRESYPYPQPPKGNMNFFSDDSIPVNLNYIAYFSEFPPFAVYNWAAGRYDPLSAEKFEIK